jgi:hypothetical protein
MFSAHSPNQGSATQVFKVVQLSAENSLGATGDSRPWERTEQAENCTPTQLSTDLRRLCSMTYGVNTSEKPWINQVVTQLLEGGELGFLNRASPMTKVRCSMPNGNLNHFRVQLDQDGSPFQHDPDCSAFVGRGNDHATEPRKWTELYGNYSALGHGPFFAIPAYDR